MNEIQWDKRACECYSRKQCTEIFNISEVNKDQDIVV